MLHTYLKFRFIALVTLTVAISCLGFSIGVPDPGLRLTVTNYGRHFEYSIAHPEVVRRAWLEVADRPIVLDSKPLKVQAKGELDWDWDDTALNEPEQDEDELFLE